MINTKRLTCNDVVEAWDRGEMIWSIEMGGLGPGYEQAIQVLIVELLRDNLTTVFPDPTEKEVFESFIDKWGDDTVHRINEKVRGFSGAQVGAAKYVAYRMLTKGYDETLESMRSHDKERLIQVSNFWPKT